VSFVVDVSTTPVSALDESFAASGDASFPELPHPRANNTEANGARGLPMEERRTIPSVARDQGVTHAPPFPAHRDVRDEQGREHEAEQWTGACSKKRGPRACIPAVEWTRSRSRSSRAPTHTRSTLTTPCTFVSAFITPLS
jgi:hypothetical protein